MMTRALCLSIAAAALLPACSTVFGAGDVSRDAAANYPISVDQQTMTLRVPVDQTLKGLPRDQVVAIDNLVTLYRRKGHGPITVTAPSGTARDLDAQETAGHVREALYEAGIDYRDILGATYRASGKPETVLISFSQYVASGPVCGDFRGATMARLNNEVPPNFGCAYQNNLAAMVADPRDLIGPQDEALRDGISASEPVRTATTPIGIVNETGVLISEGQ